MNFDLQHYKRSATSKLIDDYFKLRPSMKRKVSHHQSIKQSENGSSILKVVPVYRKGPRPSELLLRYLNAVTPPKISRMSLIKHQLLIHVSSCTTITTLEDKMHRNKRNTLKI
ncbi:hypothetical protein SteCoe_1111 [Stentor coeruleus]|uniref:Uncharacterized protein n=1 Tax=Stentor coeruleus TaxID=5963 RepID=A0A1R2D2P2_9CILI|nr:hypothetical protein SteCoe_1111 [Stentor coeruleus]